MRHLRWLFLCLLPVLAQATIFQVPFNQRTRLSVSTGDVLRLYGFPSGWPYNQIISGFDAKGTSEMSFAVSCQGVESNVSGWTANTYCPYAGTSTQDMTVTSGSAIVDFTWWLAPTSSSSATSSISSTPTSSATQTSSSSLAFNIYDVNPSQPLEITGSGGLFRISQYPDWDFNVVVVQVIPYDGKQLEGSMILPPFGKVALQGWSQQILLKEQGSIPIVFELALPEQRRIGVSWWVNNQAPDSLAIPSSQIENGDSLSITYNFSSTHLVPGNLSLHYAKSDFKDGLPPQIARLSHNPQGVRYPDPAQDMYGPTYKITATPASGQSIVVALPIPQAAIQLGIPVDSIALLHYDDITGNWNEVKPDSVANGYIYFSSTRFSHWLTRWKRKASNVVSDAGDAASDAAHVTIKGLKEVGLGLACLADGVKDGLESLYDGLVNLICTGIDPVTYVHWVKGLFNNSSPYNTPQGDVTSVVTSPYFSQNALILTTAVNEPLQAVVTSGVAANDQIDNFISSRANAQKLLADVLLARQNPNYVRKYIPTLGTLSASATAYEQYLNLGSIATLNILSGSQTAQSGITLGQLFQTSSTMLASTPRVVETLQECSCMLGVEDEFSKTWTDIKGVADNLSKASVSGTCKSLLGLPADLVNWVVPDVLTCGIEAVSFYDYYTSHNLGNFWIPNTDPGSPLKYGRDDHINRAAELLNVLSILLWVDDGYKAALGGMATDLRNQIVSYIGFVHNGYGNNNIAIKAMAGVALWDLVSKNDKTSYNTMKSWLETKSGDNGGYAEGTGYLQYVDIDVPYVLSVMVRAGLITHDELPQKYLKSGEWLRSISRTLPLSTTKKELHPVLLDDDNVMRPDFYVYSYLNNNDPSLLATADQYEPYLFEPIRFLGLPAPSTVPTSPSPALPDLYYADGVGVVRETTASGDVLTLSIIAKNGSIYDLAGGHDQQDNTSVTLDNSATGPVVLDPGYGGFQNRGNGLFATFDTHNVCMLPNGVAPFGGENPNGKVTYNDLALGLSMVPGVYNMQQGVYGWGMLFMGMLAGFPLSSALNGSLLSWMAVNGNDPFGPNGGTDGHPGGSPAYKSDLQTHTVAPVFHGLEVKHTSSAGVTNHRAILSFADHLWVIDRPDQAREMWLQWNYPIPPPNTSFSEPLTVYPMAGSSVSNSNIVGTYPALIQIPQEDNLNDLFIDRVIRSSTVGVTPVFASAYPVNATSSIGFTEVQCTNAECLHRMTTSGDEDMLVIPQWGKLFDGTALFNSTTPALSGTIILAHKQAGSPQWSFKTFGEEAASLSSAKTLSKITATLPSNAVAQIGPSGITTVNSNGSTTVLVVGTQIPLPALQLLLFQ